MATDLTYAALEKEAEVYLNERLLNTSDLVGRLAIGNRAFVIALMSGFAAKIVARELLDLMVKEETQ